MKMYEIKLLQCVAVGALSFLTFGCDDGSGGLEPGSSLRGNSGIPTKTYKQTGGSTLTVRITPDPTDCDPTGGGPFFTDEALFGRLEELLANTDRFVGASHHGSAEAEEVCESFCNDEGGEWAGDVSAQGFYNIGEAELVEAEDGSLAWDVSLEVKYELGCSCAG